MTPLSGTRAVILPSSPFQGVMKPVSDCRATILPSSFFKMVIQPPLPAMVVGAGWGGAVMATGGGEAALWTTALGVSMAL